MHTLTYDPQTGYLQSVMDALTQTTLFQRDMVGRATSVQRPDAQLISLSYDLDGNLASITPPGKPSHGFDYTPIDLVSMYTPPAVSGGGTTQYQYNADRQLTLVTRPDGGTIQLTYDPVKERLTQTTLPDASTVVYGYSSTTGKLLGISGSYGEPIAYGYDGALLTGVTWSGEVSGAVHFVYNTDLKLATEMVNSTASVSYGHDHDGLLTTAGAMTLARDAQNGRLTGSTLSTIADSYGYTPYGELASYAAVQGATELFATSYTRDALGRIATKTETVEGATHLYEYAYDLAGRLVEVKKDGAVAEHYTYDANGNRLRAMGMTADAVYDAQDRLVQYGATSYSYTANGELATMQDAESTTEYTYDAMGALRRVEQLGLLRTDYVIDSTGRRVGTKRGTTLAMGLLYRGGLAPVAELDGSGAVVGRFVYGRHVNVPDYVVRGSDTYRVITDHLGSVRLVVNVATGEVVQRMEYDSFGRVLVDEVAPSFRMVPFGFAGGLYDVETALVRFGARDYDSETGRWISKDPIGFGGGDSNVFRYVGGDPVDLFDPSGLWGIGGSAGGSFAGLGAGGALGGGVMFDVTNSSLVRFGGGGLGASVGTGPGLGAGIVLVTGEVADFFGAGYEFGGSFLNVAGALLISNDGRIIGFWIGPQTRGFDTHFWRTYTFEGAKEFEGECGKTPPFYVSELHQKGPY